MASGEENGTQLMQLPNEILECIVKDPCLSCVDICHLASTCKCLSNVCRSNDIWRSKLEQRWPAFYSRIRTLNNANWLQIFQNRYMVQIKTSKLLREMSSEFFDDDEISYEGFDGFRAMAEVDYLSPDDMMDEIWSVLHDGDSNKNLTQKFYAQKVAQYVRHMQLTPLWIQLLEKPPEEQSLETGASLLAQWCQPTDVIRLSDITTELDLIAETVRQELSVKHPKHPLFSSEHYSSGSDPMQPEHMRQVLECLNFILFTKLGFHEDTEQFYDRQNSFLNLVLTRKKGIPISLSVLYICVAGRLGVKCEPVNFPNHFLMRWREHPYKSPDQQYTFIDASSRGRFMARDDISRDLDLPDSFLRPAENCDAASSLMVFVRMLRNLVMIGRQQCQIGRSLSDLRNALELFVLISPQDVEMRLLHARVNLHFNINLSYVMESLEQVAAIDGSRLSLVIHLQNETNYLMRSREAQKARKNTKRAKRRADHESVKLSVGLVMKHKRYGYFCVIHDWDPTCEASMEWITQMGVDRLPCGASQPFYNVLVEDGSNRYAAQENLLFTHAAKPITHPDVGKYFEEFDVDHYIPNKEKQVLYPEDTDETARLLDDFHNGRIGSELCAPP